MEIYSKERMSTSANKIIQLDASFFNMLFHLHVKQIKGEGVHIYPNIRYNRLDS